MGFRKRGTGGVVREEKAGSIMPETGAGRKRDPFFTSHQGFLGAQRGRWRSKTLEHHRRNLEIGMRAASIFASSQPQAD